jgi:hypothetical protein
VPREMGEETRKTTSRGCSRMIDDGGGESGTRSAANQDVPIADYNLGGCPAGLVITGRRLYLS